MLKLRGGIYHTDFTVNGQRIRQTLKTSDWREATQRERDLIKRANEGKLATGPTAELARQFVEEAFERYLLERRTEIADPGNEAAHAKPVRAFFKDKWLNQLGAYDIRLYQGYRLQQGRAPKTINHETKILLQLKKRAKLRHLLADDVKLLKVIPEQRQMLVAAEKQRLFETASKKSAWQTAYCAALLTANTSMRPIELRRLKWYDVDPFNRLVTVRRSKTDAGTRVIPLNDEAYSAIEALKLRADKLKSYAPENFILHREKPKVDPMRPLSGWRSAWRSLRAEAAKGDEQRGISELPRLAKLRYYDLRHQCITEMLEAGIPEGVIREVAGHVDPEMTRHYSHPRLAARRAAVEALATVKLPHAQATPNRGYVTNHVTKALPPGTHAA